jgi:hypothetical protein
VRLALTRVKRELFVQLEAAGVVARVGGEHLYPTIPTAVAAFARREESKQGVFRENESSLTALERSRDMDPGAPTTPEPTPPAPAPGEEGHHDFDTQKRIHQQIRNDPDYDDWEYGTEPLPHEAWNGGQAAPDPTPGKKV